MKKKYKTQKKLLLVESNKATKKLNQENKAIVQSLLNELKAVDQDRIKGRERFFQLIMEQNFSKAFLHVCTFCDADNKAQLELIRILLKYEETLALNLYEEDDDAQMNCFDYALLNNNPSLFLLLASKTPPKFKPRSMRLHCDLDEQEILKICREKNPIREHKELMLRANVISNALDKFKFLSDDENSRHDLTRIQFIIRAIDYLGKYQFDFSNMKELTQNDIRAIEIHALDQS